jgi:glycosyltransferase involved in cell wall biosynthesis
MGGVGVYQKYLAGMSAQDVTQIFLMPQEHAGIMEGDPRVQGYALGKRGLGGVFRQIRALGTAITREGPDVVMFHSTFSLLALALTRLRRGRAKRPRLIYIAHGWAGEQYSGAKQRLVRTVEGTLCGFADLVINVSHNDLETARRHGYRGRHAVIENAVPDAVAGARDDCFAAEPEALHLLFVGRFDRQKGLDILLEALARAQERRPELKLHVIGGAVRDGSGSALPEGIDLIGWVPRDEVDGWYASADAVVLASRWEGLPLVIPEALRNGTPVVVSQRSGMEHLFDEGQEGFSYPLTVEALADRLVTLDKARLRAMRPACRALYERRYSMPRLHAEILRAYRGEIEVVWKHGDRVPG